MIPDVAIGAVIAALIGAMISLIGLVVTKEAKVSEFRQSWIDKLRGELALFITHLSAMEDAARVRFETPKERFEKTRDSIAKLNEAYFTVALRLNPDESEAKAVKTAMVSLAQMVVDPNRDEVAYGKHKVAFVDSANALLKAEWVRVRDGEKTYKSARKVAFWAVILLFVAAVGAVLIGGVKSTKKRSNEAPNVNVVNYSDSESKSGALRSMPIGSNGLVKHAPLEARPSAVGSPSLARERDAHKSTPSGGQR